MNIAWPPLPFEIDQDLGTVLVRRFLRFKAVVKNYPDLKIFVSPSFLAFLKKRLNVSKCKTLSGVTLSSQFRIDTVDIYVDEQSNIPFYIYY